MSEEWLEIRRKFILQEQVRVIVNKKCSYVDKITEIEWCYKEKDWKYLLKRDGCWYYAEELQKEPNANPNWEDKDSVFVPELIKEKRK